MTFNQTVWDVLCEAHYVGIGKSGDAINQYAAACDGKADWSSSNTYPVFVPNPIPKY